VLVCTRELLVPNKNMVERVVGSTYSSSNVHEVVNDNNCNIPYLEIKATLLCQPKIENFFSYIYIYSWFSY